MVAGSYTSKKDPVYKDSKRKFKKNALLGDLSDRKKGSEIGRYHKNYDKITSDDNRMKKKDAPKKKKEEFYKDALGPNVEDKENKDTNVKKVNRVNLKDFLRMYKKFSYEEPD